MTHAQLGFQLVQYFHFTGELRLGPILVEPGTPLNEGQANVWEVVTSQFMEQYYEGKELDFPIDQAIVEVSLQQQTQLIDEETDDVEITFYFEAYVSWASSSTDYDPGLLILEIFPPQSGFMTYISMLWDSEEAAFSAVSSLAMKTKSSTKLDGPPDWATTSTPTKSLTKSPTDSPTNSPTKTPTLRPTRNPTKAPTRNPTKAPTASPQVAPTSNTATPNPTVANTMEPTHSEQGEMHVYSSTTKLLFLGTIDIMEVRTLIEWAKITSEYLEEHILGLDTPDELEGLEVEIGRTDQKELEIDGKSALHVEFLARLILPLAAEDDSFNADSLVHTAFTTSGRRREYRDRLIASGGSFFEDLETVTFVNTDSSINDLLKGDTQESSSSKTVVIAASVGAAGLVFVMMLVYGLFYRQRDDKPSVQTGSVKENGVQLSPVGTSTGALSWEQANPPGATKIGQEVVGHGHAEIVVDKSMDDDISAMPDPFWEMNMESDDKTCADRTVNDDSILHSYDYLNMLKNEPKGDILGKRSEDDDEEDPNFFKDDDDDPTFFKNMGM